MLYQQRAFIPIKFIVLLILENILYMSTSKISIKKIKTLIVLNRILDKYSFKVVKIMHKDKHIADTNEYLYFQVGNGILFKISE